MKISAIMLLLVAALSTTGCLGAAIASSNKARAHDREAFAKTNLEREAAGLAPLTKAQFMNMGTTTTTTTMVPVTTTTLAPVTTVTTVTPTEPTVTKRHVNIR